MSDLQSEIESSLKRAVVEAFGPEHTDADPLVRPASDPKFGDFQANLAMGLAKRLGRKPRDVADAIVGRLPADGMLASVEVAGPGFINLTLNADRLARAAAEMAADPRLSIAPATTPQTVVVDYSAPNIAKEMHIGHLRSTILGDAIVRVLEKLNHRVIRQNHLGDWGTQFGMLIEHLIDQGADAGDDRARIGDLNAFYKQAKARFDSEPDFADRARRRVVLLQSGDEATLAYWRQLHAESYRHFREIYERLNVRLEQRDIRGESAYNDELPDVVRELELAGLLTESEGARVVYPEGFKDKEGNPLGMIVRKTDGGYLYATTDLAAARYRIRQIQADRIIYVTDQRQSQHFAMLFQALRQAGWADESVRLDHVPFGMIYDKDRRPYKTREGETVRLADVLDEAEQRAAAVIAEKSPDLPAEQRQRIARVVGIGALKYADLSSDRVKGYVFDWDRMLALEGNTAPYLQYSYTRVRSIFAKAAERGLDVSAISGDAAGVVDHETLRITEPAERRLVLHLLQLPRVVEAVADTLEPHRLCTFLYELAALFHGFYETCPVINAEDEATRLSRLRLCDLVGRTLRDGLDLLGIEVVERM